MIEHLSYSSISLFLDCPAAWRMKYLDKLPTRSGPALVFGSAWHNTIETFLTQAEYKPLPELWQAAWISQMERDGASVDWGFETPESHFNQGYTWATAPKIASDNGDYAGMETFLKTIKPQVREGKPSIERKIELRVPGVPIPVIGYIDITTDDGVPGDFKTSSKSWGADKATGSLQTLFYLAALNQLGEPVKDGRFRHYVFIKNKTPKVQVIEHVHNMKEMFFLFRVIKNVWDAINLGAFPENPTTWRCSGDFCDFYSSCRGKFL